MPGRGLSPLGAGPAPERSFQGFPTLGGDVPATILLPSRPNCAVSTVSAPLTEAHGVAQCTEWE